MKGEAAIAPLPAPDIVPVGRSTLVHQKRGRAIGAWRGTERLTEGQRSVWPPHDLTCRKGSAFIALKHHRRGHTLAQ